MGHFLRKPALASVSPTDVVLRKLGTVADLTTEHKDSLRRLAEHVETHQPGAEITFSDDGAHRLAFLVSGWACRLRMMLDGRRQIFSFIVPGDPIGVWRRPPPMTAPPVIALTRAETIDATSLLVATPGPSSAGRLAEICAAAVRLEDDRLLDHIVRLGCQTAYERLAHLLLELHHRLSIVGLADGDRYRLPLTQENMADALGLSIVHVNRTLQQLRRERLIDYRLGWVSLLKPERLAAIADFQEGAAIKPWIAAAETEIGLRAG